MQPKPIAERTVQLDHQERQGEEGFRMSNSIQQTAESSSTQSGCHHCKHQWCICKQPETMTFGQEKCQKQTTSSGFKKLSSKNRWKVIVSDESSFWLCPENRWELPWRLKCGAALASCPKTQLWIKIIQRIIKNHKESSSRDNFFQQSRDDLVKIAIFLA